MAKPKAPKAKRTASAIGRSSRVKGKVYEREIANALKPVYPGAKRGIGQVRAAGEVPDVDGTPWWCETKHHKRSNIRKAYVQAVAAKATSSSPVHRTASVLVITRDTGVPPDLVTMDFNTFMQLIANLERFRAAAIDRIAEL